MFNLYNVSLLRNCTSILLLSKTSMNLKLRASAHIAWSCMKFRLFYNLELLQYKVIKTCRHIQQRWSSWKSKKEDRMNLDILKNLFGYIFALWVCKSANFKVKKKKKQKKDSQTVYILTLYQPCPLPPPFLYALVCFWTDPPSPYLRTYFINGPLHRIFNIVHTWK